MKSIAAILFAFMASQSGAQNVPAAVPPVPATTGSAALPPWVVATTAGGAAVTTLAAPGSTTAPATTLAPGTTAAAPATTLAAPATTTGAPGTTANPFNPATSTTAAPQPSTTAPAATNVFGSTNPGHSLPPIYPTDPSKMVCDGAICANRVVNIQASNDYQFECIMPNGCAGSIINIVAGYDPQNPALIVDRITELIFKDVGSGAGATVYITNQLAAYGHTVEVESIACEKAGSCTGLTVLAGPGVNVEGSTVECQVPGACQNCFVKQGSNNEACDPGYMEYPNMPIVPPAFGYPFPL